MVKFHQREDVRYLSKIDLKIVCINVLEADVYSLVGPKDWVSWRTSRKMELQ